MTPSSSRREPPYCASDYAAPCHEHPQHYPANQFPVQDTISSHQGYFSQLIPTCVSTSSYKSTYVRYSTTSECAIDDDTSGQRNSYCASEGQSYRDGNGTPHYDSTTTRGTHNNHTGAIGQNFALRGYDSVTNVPRQFGSGFASGASTMELASPCDGPYPDPSPQESRPMAFSSNGYSSMGSHFQLRESLEFEGDLFMDPVFFPDSSTDVDLNPNSTAASQTTSNNHFTPLDPYLATSGHVLPAFSTASAHMNSPYCDVSAPTLHKGRAVTPTYRPTRIAPRMTRMSRSSTGSKASLNTSPSFSSSETSPLNRPLEASRSCYNVTSSAAGSQIPLTYLAASLGYPANDTSPIVAVLADALNPIPSSSRLPQETTSSLDSIRTLTPNESQADGYLEYSKSLDANFTAHPFSNPPVSATRRNLKPGISKCPWQGCSTITRETHHKSNMRKHIRTTHERSFPPLCEICGKPFKTNSSLKRHMENRHRLVFAKGIRTVQMVKADGTLYATYR